MQLIFQRLRKRASKQIINIIYYCTTWLLKLFCQDSTGIRNHGIQTSSVMYHEVAKRQRGPLVDGYTNSKCNFPMKPWKGKSMLRKNRKAKSSIAMMVTTTAVATDNNRCTLPLTNPKVTSPLVTYSSSSTLATKTIPELAPLDETQQENSQPVDSLYHNLLTAQSLSSSIHQRLANVVQVEPNGVKAWICDVLFSSQTINTRNIAGKVPSSSIDIRRNVLSQLSDGENERKIVQVLDRMRSEMVYPLMRLFGYGLCKVFRLLFDGLNVDAKSIRQVRQTLLNAGPDVGLVYLPTHKSHMDYMIMSFICFAYGLPLPRIAAGNNLDLPIIGSFLRRNGSFFIKRSIKGDVLYSNILKQYLHALVCHGDPIEVFIEGGRSRHGRVCQPRLGFLQMLADVFHLQPHTAPKDLLLLPISIDYDCVLESSEYARYLMGAEKKKESFFGVLQAAFGLLWTNCGHVYVRFGQPQSLIQSAQQSNSIADIGNQMAYQMQRLATIPSTAFVAAYLLYCGRDTLCRDMVHAISILVDLVTSRGIQVAENGDPQRIATQGLRMLHRFVEITDEGCRIHPDYRHNPHVYLQLSYYRNQFLYHFLPDIATQCVLIRNVELSKVVESVEMLGSYLELLCPHEPLEGIQPLQSHEDTPFVRAFLASFAHPFVESMCILLETIRLLPTLGPELELKQIVAECQDLFLVHGSSAFPEAICTESFKQALKWCLNQHLVEYNKNFYFLAASDAKILDTLMHFHKIR